MPRATHQDVIVRMVLENQEMLSGLQKTERQTAATSRKMGASWGAVAGNVTLYSAAVIGAGIAISRALRPAIEWQDAQVRMGVIAQGNVQLLGQMSAIVDANAGGMFKRADIAAALNYAGAVGFNIEKTQKLLPLLRDVAAVYGEDITVALQAVVRAALFGEAELAERIGLTLREGAILDVTTRLYGKKLSQLNKEQKINAVVTASIEQLSRVRGGEAKAAETVSGAYKKMQTAGEEFAVSTTEVFLPAIVSATKGLTVMVGYMGGYLLAVSKIIKVYEKLGLIEKVAAAAAATGMPGIDIQRYSDANPFGTVLDFPEGGDGVTQFGPPIQGEMERADIERRQRRMRARLELDRETAEMTARINGSAPKAPGSVLEFEDKDTSGLDRGREDAAENAREELHRQSLIRLGIIQEHEDAVRAVEFDSQSAREAAAIAFAVNMQNIAMQSGRALLMGDITTAKKRDALLRYFGKSALASTIELASAEFVGKMKFKAKEYAILAAGAAASLNFGSAAKFAAAATAAGLAAGAAPAIVGAINTGAARDLDYATNRVSNVEAGRDPDRVSGLGVGSSSAARRAVTAAVNRGPENVYINVNTVIEGNIFSGEAGAAEYYSGYIREHIASDLSTSNLQAVA